MLSGRIDISSMDKNTELVKEAEAKSLHYAMTECCYIFAESTNQKLDEGARVFVRLFLF